MAEPHAHSQPIETYGRAPHNRLRNAWPILLSAIHPVVYPLLTDLRLLTERERIPAGIEDIRLAAYSQTREREEEHQAKKEILLLKGYTREGQRHAIRNREENDTQKNGKTKRGRG